MEIHPFVLGSFEVSAYVVVADRLEAGGRRLEERRAVPPASSLLSPAYSAAVIDAPEGSEAIIEFCDDRGLVPDILVNTHGHGDHIFANALLRKRWPEMKIAIGKADGPMLGSPLRNLSVVMGAWVKGPKADRLLEDGDRIEVGSASLEVLATPGHSRGGISLYTPDGPDGRPVVFTGDALFAGGIGRTDFPGASHKTLLESIRKRLFALPPETVVYPGHGPPTTVGEEARTNPFL